MMDAEQAIAWLQALLSIRKDYTCLPITNVNAELLIDLITRQQAVCDAAKEAQQHDYITPELNDALKRLKDKS